MNKVFAVILVLSYLASAKALTCWVCENVQSNSECIRRGRAMRCQSNELACQISVRRGSFGMLITKRCKQAEACENNFVQNPRAAWQPSQCNTQAPSSVCRCCCNTDLCNRDSLDCVQRDIPTCQRIGVPRNGRTSCDPSPDNRERISTVGTVCTFRCNVGFALRGRVTSTCLERQRQNVNVAEFNNPVPQCIPATCEPPRAAPGNGGVRCTNRNNVNSVCTYTCNAGFARSGSRTTTCGRDNQWTQPPPSCEPVTCLPRHTNPSSGQVSCTNGNNYNSVCRFTCDSGYFLNGADQSRCTDDGDGDVDGVWSADPPTCVRIICNPEQRAPGNGSVSCSDGRNEGSVCSFNCISGYFLNGVTTTTCEDDLNGDAEGTWSDPPPSCEQITCNPPLNRPNNGRIRCSDFNILGSSCRFTCNTNFARIGPEISVCNDDNNGDALGQWSATPPLCQPITCQPRYTEIGNGTVSCTNENFAESECTFTCNSNNFALLGNPISTCLTSDDGGVRGRWSFPAPSCLLKRCVPQPASPVNGGVVCSEGNVLGSRCEFTCDDYHTRVGPLYTTCVEDTSSNTLSWDNPAPVCQPNRCPQQTLPHGSVTCDDQELDATTTCSFECVDPDYQLYPPSLTENRCLNDTTWNISRPCCTRPCPPFANMDFVVVLDSSSSIGNENWITLKSFARNIINTFNVGPDSARIGVFRYNKEIDTATQILLNSHPTNKTAILEAFDAIPYNGSGTFTGQALEHARDVLFVPGNGNRPDVRDVMLIITDGRAQDSDVLVEAARDLQRDGVLVFVLGIIPPRGTLDTNQLETIAGNPNNVIIAEQGFQGLDDQLITSISTQICGDPCAEDPRPT